MMWNKNLAQKKKVIKATKYQLSELIASPWMLDVVLLMCCLVEEIVSSPLKLDNIFFWLFSSTTKFWVIVQQMKNCMMDDKWEKQLHNNEKLGNQNCIMD